MRPGVFCILLAVTTLAVFLPVGRHGYVNYDDSDYVTANPHVQSGLGWETVIWAFKSGHASNSHFGPIYPRRVPSPGVPITSILPRRGVIKSG